MAHASTGIGRRTLLAGASGMVVLAAVGGLSGCSKDDSAVKPVDINPDQDTCARCGMMISEVRHAAEMITLNATLKFDDVGEMFLYHKEKDIDEASVRAMYVEDYHEMTWVPAQEAHYVISAAIPTPMGTHVAAFRQPDATSEFTESGHGQARTFDQLLASPAPGMRPEKSMG